MYKYVYIHDVVSSFYTYSGLAEKKEGKYEESVDGDRRSEVKERAVQREDGVASLSLNRGPKNDLFWSMKNKLPSNENSLRWFIRATTPRCRRWRLNTLNIPIS